VDEPEVLEMTVRAYDYTEGTASDVTPSFELSGAPADGGYRYGVSVNGGDVQLIDGDTYTVADSGTYEIVFFLLNENGLAVDTSKTYDVVLDFTQAAQSNEAWMSVNGEKVYGSLASLLRQANAGDTIYLLTNDVIALNDTSKLSSVNLVPDPDVFGNDNYVIVSTDSPDGE